MGHLPLMARLCTYPVYVYMQHGQDSSDLFQKFYSPGSARVLTQPLSPEPLPCFSKHQSIQGRYLFTQDGNAMYLCVVIGVEHCNSNAMFVVCEPLTERVRRVILPFSTRCSMKAGHRIV